MVAKDTVTMAKSKRLKVYVDASIRPTTQALLTDKSQQVSNSGIGVHFDDTLRGDVSFKVITTRCAISRIEMIAVRTALLLTFHIERIIIYTDSQHCIMSLSPEIINRSWFNVNGTSHMAESDIARECTEIIRARSVMGRKTKILKVMAHNGVHGNIVADKLAGSAATGNYSAIITDNTTYSNGVAITTEDTHSAIARAGRDLHVDITSALKMTSTQSIASSSRTVAPTASGVKPTVGLANYSSLRGTADVSDDSDDDLMPRTVAADGTAKCPELTGNESVTFEQLFHTDSTSLAGNKRAVQDHPMFGMRDDVIEADQAIVNDIADITPPLMLSSLVCISCLDAVLIKHRNYKLFDGLDSTLGLTHCRTCVQEITKSKSPDSSLSAAVGGAWINPALLRGSNVCSAAAGVTGRDVTVLSIGQRARYFPYRQVFSTLTRSDEVHGLDIDNSELTPLHGGFF